MSTKQSTQADLDKKKKERENQIKAIQDQFKKLDPELQSAIMAEAKSMKEITTIAEFNEIISELLKFITNITKQNPKYGNYDFSGFDTLFRTGLKADGRIAISNFTMVSLPLADKVLLRDDTFFLEQFDPSEIDNAIDKKGSGLNIFTSDKFKELWRKLDQPYKDHIFDKAGLLIYKGFVYFAQMSAPKK